MSVTKNVCHTLFLSVTNNVCHTLEIWVQPKMIDDAYAIIVQAVAFAAAEILHKEESSVSSYWW